MNILENLIEELDNTIHSEFAVSYPPWSELGHEDFARSMITWMKIITRIGKAYAEGMPLPDEVERITFRGAASLNLARGDILIILRKEGTGKDEEND